MKKLAVWLMLAIMFFAAVSAGCGGGSSGGGNSDSPDEGQTENFNEENSDNGGYDPDEEGRGGSGSTVDLSTITAPYTASNGQTLTGKLGANVKI